MPKQYFRGKPIGYKIMYSSSVEDSLNFVYVNYTTNTINLTELYVFSSYVVVVSTVGSGGEGLGKGTFTSTGENRLLFFPCLVNFFAVLRRSRPLIVPVSPVELLPLHIFIF